MMTEQLPEPLTPSDCDLRGFAFMPLDTVRLLDSDLFALSTGEEFKAAVALWCKAWQQVPAGSLPDDDRILAHLSGAGRSWKRVKAMALRGWIKCSDARLYHPTVAEKAWEAFERREGYTQKQGNKETRQQRWRNRVKELSAQLRDLGVTPPQRVSLSTLERLLVDAQASTKRLPVDARETALTGTETGKISSVAKATGADAPPIDPEKQFWNTAKAYLAAAGVKNPGAVIGKWLRDHDRADVQSALTRSQIERAVDPVAFVGGVLRKRQRDDGGPIMIKGLC